MNYPCISYKPLILVSKKQREIAEPISEGELPNEAQAKYFKKKQQSNIEAKHSMSQFNREGFLYNGIIKQCLSKQPE